MRTWQRSLVDQLCGGCGTRIPKGDPTLVITLRGVHKPRVRCVACAGPAPELAPLVARPPAAPLPFTRFTPDMLPLDWKVRQAGEEPRELAVIGAGREPGEEG